MLPREFTNFSMQLFHHHCQQIARFIKRIGDEGKPCIAVRNHIGARIHRTRIIAFGGRRLQLRVEFLCTRAQNFRRGSMQHDRLRVAMQAIRGTLLRFVFFQDDMEVGAAKSKRADSSTTRMFPANPRASLCVQIKRRVFNIQLRMRLLNVDRGRQYFVMQSQRNLDHARRARRRFGVPDLRFDAAQCNILTFQIVFSKDLIECGYLAQIACDRASAVRFDQPDCGGRKPRRLICPMKR